MTLTAVVLIVASAFIHAGWNLIGKRNEPSPAFFLIANLLGCMCLLPVALTHTHLIALFPLQTWAFIGATGIFQAIYFTGLAGAYRTGHLSVAYPLARSAPVIMVAGLNVLIGKVDQLSVLSIVGMLLITAGALLLPINGSGRWTLKDYLHVSSLFALMAAIGTVGYSMVDDTALRALRASPGVQSSRVAITLVYAMFEGLSSSLWLGICLLANRTDRTTFGGVLRRNIGSAALAGVGIFLAYSLILIAMGYARNVSYVVAFRQLSIPLGALFGVLLLKEPCNACKSIGLAIMVAGLVLVGIG